MANVADAMRATNADQPLVVVVTRPTAAAPTTPSRFKLDVTLEYEEGEPVGVYVDRDLVVTRVVAGMCADGLLQVETGRW